MILNNPKIVGYLKDKDTLIKEGRSISSFIEKLELRIAINDKAQRKITAKVETKELIKKGNALQTEINAKLKELEEVAYQIQRKKLNAIPVKIKEEFFELKGKKEALEKDRNKVALKVQKIKDRMIPLIQKEVKPLLKEYEDIETVILKDGQAEVKVFDRLADWKKSFKK